MSVFFANEQNDKVVDGEQLTGVALVAMEAEDDEEADDEPWLLGDVVLCPAYAARQAARAGQTLAAELEMLVVHGILHLCGMDHAEPEEERIMKARTDELLARWRAEPSRRPDAAPRGGTGG